MSDDFADLRTKFANRLAPRARLDFGPGWGMLLRVALHWLDGCTVDFSEGIPKFQEDTVRGVLMSGKEKYGCLVIRVDHHPERYDEVEQFRERVRKQSLSICEKCGRRGRLRFSYHRIKTYCDDHAYLAEPIDPDRDGKILDVYDDA